MFIGPPISIAIIAPNTKPSNTFEVPPRLAKKLTIALFIATTGGSTINVIIIPIKSVPNSGNNNTGFIPSKDCGSLLNNFLSPTTKYPAKKPAIKAPKNPAPPSFAIAPPTNPTTRAGLSAIE